MAHEWSPAQSYQPKLAYRAELITCSNPDAERSTRSAATCTSEDAIERSVKIPAKDHAASGTRDFNGTLPIVFIMAIFPLKAHSVLKQLGSRAFRSHINHKYGALSEIVCCAALLQRVRTASTALSGEFCGPEPSA